jgi:hypothetical protein
MKKQSEIKNMESKIDISQIRNAENDYAAINEISERLCDVIYNKNIENEDAETIMTISEQISKIEDKLFYKAQELCKNYIEQNKGMAI